MRRKLKFRNEINQILPRPVDGRRLLCCNISIHTYKKIIILLRIEEISRFFALHVKIVLYIYDTGLYDCTASTLICNT